VLALRTILLLALAQIVAPPTPPTPATQSLPSTIRWTIPISASPAAPPVIDGDRVFIVLQSGLVAARRVSDGTQAWETPLKSDRPVAIDSGHAYVATADHVEAVNVADGVTAWRVKTGPVAAPLLASGGWLIVVTADHVAAFRAADGSEVWTRELGPSHVTPAIEGDSLYVPLEDGRLFALDLHTGADRWHRAYKGPLSEVLSLPDRLYFGTGDKYFFCVRASDGELEWPRVRMGSLVRGQPVADDTRIYVTSMDNTLRAYRRSTGALLWHPSVPFRPTTGPVLVDSAVIVSGAAAELRAFAITTGQPAGEIKLEEPLVMPPAFGRSEAATVMAGFIGSLNSQWKLVLAGPPAPVPSTLPE
jgi:outer membrane protein assembly factor BamB